MPHTTSKYTRKRQRRRPEAGEGPIEEGRTNGRTLLLFSTSHRPTLHTRSIILTGRVGVTTGCYYYCVAGLGNICDQITCIIGKALLF